MTDQIQELLGKRIAAFRKAAGMTQVQLADRLSVANETVSRMERGTTTPSIKTLARIAEVLKVPLREFFNSEGETSELDLALDDLMTVLRQRSPQEIRIVQAVAVSLFESLDQGA